MRVLRYLAGFIAALLLNAVRWTCRLTTLADPRPALRQQGRPYIICLLHAHQLLAVFANDEPRMLAMVSRSSDGDYLVPFLWLRRVRAVRGSTRKDRVEKGGKQALAELREGLAAGIPPLFAVDGPRGPRGQVQRGAAQLAVESGRPVIAAVLHCSRRRILERAWDRFQIPLPFARLTLSIAGPIEPAGRDVESVRREIEEHLAALEWRLDPDEARRARGDGETRADV
ncbi:MAG: DUF374 domain-containing protein [Myxococcales bacterium]|nr:DUF374 domain-containing protein [Myxococcales bacterium]